MKFYYFLFVDTVRAVDGDRGVNNGISYSISNEARHIFGIDEYSGIVSNLKSLDRESPSTNNGAYIVQITVCLFYAFKTCY